MNTREKRITLSGRPSRRPTEVSYVNVIGFTMSWWNGRRWKNLLTKTRWNSPRSSQTYVVVSLVTMDKKNWTQLEQSISPFKEFCQVTKPRTTSDGWREREGRIIFTHFTSFLRLNEQHLLTLPFWIRKSRVKVIPIKTSRHLQKLSPKKKGRSLLRRGRCFQRKLLKPTIDRERIPLKFQIQILAKCVTDRTDFGAA